MRRFMVLSVAVLALLALAAGPVFAQDAYPPPVDDTDVLGREGTRDRDDDDGAAGDDGDVAGEDDTRDDDADAILPAVGAGDDDAAAVTSDEQLAATGLELTTGVALSVALLIAGFAALFYARRRSRA